MKRSQFLAALDTIVPLSAAGYEKDALGLQIGYGDALSTILCAYEVTEAVVAEAAKRGADLILTFHPLIFPSVREMNDRTRTGQLVAELIRKNIAVYSLHTAFDTLPEIGTSWRMSVALGLSAIEPLQKLEGKFGSQGFGMGVIGSWDAPLPIENALNRIKSAFSATVLRHSRVVNNELSRIAMVGGSGMDYYDEVFRAKADVFITADVRYHDFYRAEHDGILLIDAGHAETERFVAKGMTIVAQKAVEFVLAESRAQGDKSNPPSVLESEAAPNAVKYYL